MFFSIFFVPFLFLVLAPAVCFSFEAQGCRFIFQVVFNHASALNSPFISFFSPPRVAKNPGVPSAPTLQVLSVHSRIGDIWHPALEI